uniref:S-layer homology domain-containing protein n=1 Tax=Peptoniphilus duerdenii TaxID=507750 RepID=UPI00288A9B7F
NETKNVGDKITVNENTTVTAKYTPIMVDVIFDKGKGSGEKAKASVAKGSEYTLPDSEGFTPPENQKFAGWVVNGEDKKVGDKITVTENTTVTAKYTPIMVDVIFDKGKGSGEKAKASVAKGSEYTLPDSEGFTAPEGKEFSGWQVGNETKNVGDKITVNENTTVIAKWTDKSAKIEYNVTFEGNGGTGSMVQKTVEKDKKYILPSNGFTAPEGKEFDGWMIGNEKKSVGDEITVTDNITVVAQWKDKTTTPNPQDPEQNIKAPTVTVDLRTGNLIITPPAVENIKSVTVNYQDLTGSNKTATVEKSSENWSLVPAATNGETANSSTGVITIPRGKYKLGAAVKAFANNNSNQKSGEVEATPLEVSFDVNGGSKGVESSITLMNQFYVLPAIYELPEYMYTAPEGKEFAGWEVDGVTKPVGISIQITKNTVLRAIWKDKGQDPIPQPNPDSQVYNPWWPIWFGSSEVKPAEPKVEYERGLHRKYLYGYKDHTVRPEGLITRAEAAALIARLAELDMSNNMKPNFKDTPSAWYNTAINAVVAKNLMFADKDGDFRPNEPITRGEFARALFFIDKKNDKVAPFADVKGHVYEEAINQAYGNDRIKGYPDGTFKPDATITRAEAATILNNYADRNVTFKGMVEVHKDVVKFTDINESHWAYYEIMEAANTHEYQREKGTIPETWLEILKK